MLLSALNKTPEKSASSLSALSKSKMLQKYIHIGHYVSFLVVLTEGEFYWTLTKGEALLLDI